ncbi:Protein LSM14 B [Merluccius polli]|uniref:Protein LSM14 B n=1 Tax=Merluccius polli TaxID=89951 RepID=A0AA47MNA6_MERPO|nr:Protein LSM14 B [Merluccius polli]
MSSAKPYIGCKLGLISKAQNRYEGILYTIDTINSTVVLEKVKCFGTEGRPTNKPVSPKHDIFEYITFRGSDIKDITLCEPPRSHHSLPNDPAIIQSSGGMSSGLYAPQGGPFSPRRMPSYNQLASSCLLNQQYPGVHGFGPVLPGQHVRRAPMVEKAVQTVRVEMPTQRTELSAGRDQGARSMTTRASRPTSPVNKRIEDKVDIMKLDLHQGEVKITCSFNWRKNHGWQMAEYAASSPLKFETDFDFDSSNAQFIKVVLDREMQDWLKRKVGGNVK